MPTEVISGPYHAPAARYHETRDAAQYTRTIRVTATLNNPLTLTGSYANNAGFMVFNTSSIVISSSNGQGFVASNFHEANTAHQIYPIALSYVSASSGGDIAVLYNY